MQPTLLRVRSAVLAALFAALAAACTSSSPTDVETEAGKGAKLQVSPVQVDFGSSGTIATLTLENTNKRAFAWTASENAGWLTLEATSGTLWGGATRTLTLSANRTGLGAGSYAVNLTISASTGGGTDVVPVSITVASNGTTPAQLVVAPLQVDFGSSATTASMTLSNTGDASLTWTASESADWLALGATSGTLAGKSSATVSLSAARSGLTAGTYATSVVVAAGAAGSATESVSMTVPPSSPPPSEILLSGQLIDQFGGQGLSGLTVEFKGKTTTSDAGGWFTLSGSPTSASSELKLSGSGVYQRITYAKTGDALWGVVPSSFDMSAYNDVAREEWSTASVRWMAPPTVYVDTRPEGFEGGAELDQWITEVQSQAAGFVSRWTGATLSPAAVIVTSSPPQDFTAGTIVIHFSDNNSDYGNNTANIGYARLGWSSSGSISGAAVWLRYVRYPGTGGASKRTGILGHELGHAMGMGHMNGSTPSFMAPSIGSNTDLKPFDTQAAALLYGRSPGNEAPDTDSSAGPQGQLVPAAAVRVAEWVCAAGEDLPRR